MLERRKKIVIEEQEQGRLERRAMRICIGSAALFGFLGVASGAFAAHALRTQLTPQALGWVDTASDYLRPNPAVGCVIVRQGRLLVGAAGSMALGGLLFSGSLIVMALTGVTGLAVITPFGGLLLLLGWCGLAVLAVRGRARKSD